MTEYRIETRHGFYSACEKIGGYEFPAKFNASFRGATVYDSKARALTVVKKLRLSSHTVYLHEVSC